MLVVMLLTAGCCCVSRISAPCGDYYVAMGILFLAA